MGGNNEFFENLERNKYLKKLPSMQRIKYPVNKGFIRAVETVYILSREGERVSCCPSFSSMETFAEWHQYDYTRVQNVKWFSPNK